MVGSLGQSANKVALLTVTSFCSLPQSHSLWNRKLVFPASSFFARQSVHRLTQVICKV